MDSKSMKGMGPAVPHLADKPGGLAGEIHDLRGDVDRAFKRLETGGVKVEEWLAPPTASLIYFLAATALTDAAQHLHSSAVQLAAARNLVLDVVVTAGVGAGDIVVTYLDAEGVQKTHTETMPAASLTVDLLFPVTQVLSVDLPAATAPLAATVSVGFGDAIGLANEVMIRSFGEHVLEEMLDGTLIVPFTGTFVDATTAPPNGTYTPATAPDGAHNYLLTYERV